MEEKIRTEEKADEQTALATPEPENANSLIAGAEENEVDTQQPEEQIAPESKFEQGQEPEPANQEDTPEAVNQEDTPEAVGRTFTQAEVDKLVGKIRSEARERGKKEALEELLNKYGYDDVSQLDDTVGESERYAGQQDEYENLKNENLLLKSGIDESRFEDALAYFAYKDIPMNPITLEEAIESHPEWTGLDSVNFSDEEDEEEKPSVVRRLGAEPIRREENVGESDEERAMRFMGLK